MPTDHRSRLREIRTFPQLVAYLRDEMGWPIGSEDFEELTFEYTPEELGIDAKNTAKIQEIKRLRPLSTNQPWGIFFVRFEPKRLPVGALRRILSRVALKKRASANSAERAAWSVEDLLFVSNYGEGEDRQITFAHFARKEGKNDLPTLKVLGWDNLDTPLHLDDVAGVLTERLAWPDDEDDAEAWGKQWRSAFSLLHREVINTSKKLSVELAGLARDIRARINTILEIETDKGPVSKLMAAFKQALVHDLDEDGFADMYAQTIAYGLLSARVANPSGGTADDFAAAMPVTNPFLKELMESFLAVGGRKGKAESIGLDFDELGVSEVVDLLDAANMEAVVRDFGDRNPLQDPIIHFYEHFLAAYDKKQKIQRGVFYTPLPVVSFIVRSVHELLRAEFGLSEGLADGTTWGEMVLRHEGLEIPEGVSPDQPFVQVLDPAAGTGTFLVEVVDLIHTTMIDKWTGEGRSGVEVTNLWNEYVPEKLLPRIHGYEILMAPYAIAHLKIGLKLHETGYRFRGEQRVQVFLTNALEPASDRGQIEMEGVLPALAHEAQAVCQVKSERRFTVVIGNPPYSGTSANTGEWISTLVRDYYRVDGAEMKERNPKWLQDDYVKFIRLGQALCSMSPLSVLAFISNHGYIDNPTFRGMRQSLLGGFTQLRVLDLHGNLKKKEKAPDGGLDENVFDIQQGVAILLAAQVLGGRSHLRKADLFGTRREKYDELNRRPRGATDWQTVNPVSPFYLFLPQDEQLRAEYLRWPSIRDLMPVSVLGFQTHRDLFAIALDRGTIVSRCEALLDEALEDDEIRATFGLRDNQGWSLASARSAIRDDPDWEEHTIRCLYRPFDTRWCYFSHVAMDRPRRQLLDHVAGKDNLTLLVPRQLGILPWRHLGVSDTVAESCLISTKTKEQNYNFPLYVYPESDTLALYSSRRPNLSASFISSLASAVGLPRQENTDLPSEIVPEDVFNYVYAVFSSSRYRSRYADFLKTDFPHVPLPGGLDLFGVLTHLGSELVSLHLLKSSTLEDPITTIRGPASSEITRVGWSDGTVWLDAGKTDARSGYRATEPGTIGFEGVPEEVWDFHIGGYQVCHKWLKDRKGRTLSGEDIEHYQKIVVALSETIRIMVEIDEVIEEHGGWPGAFLASDNPAGTL